MDYSTMTPAQARALIREEKITGQTSGMCAGYAQANLVILPKDLAYDFLLFTQRNPKSCPDVYKRQQHIFSIIDKQSGEILSNPSVFHNNQDGFLLLIGKLSCYAKSQLLIGMEDTGHYHFALLKYLLNRHYTVALINPTTTDLTRKLQGGITKNDPLDSPVSYTHLDVYKRQPEPGTSRRLWLATRTIRNWKK